MDKVRWGLLSTANINRRLIPAIRASKRGELVAVASRKRSAAKKYAKHWEIPNFYGSYEKMLASDIDSVYISLPNHLHALWSIKAMEAGKHVLCEKPFALSLEDVDNMITVSQRHKRVLAEAFMYRHHPQTKIAGKVVQSGKLGDVVVVRGVFNFSMGKPERNIRLEPEYGGGCLWDVGVYPLSFAQFIMGGVPEKVFGDQWVGETGVDETFCGQMYYSGGRMAQILSSFRTPFNTFVEILGTEGRLALNRPFTLLDEDRKMIFYSRKGDIEEIPVPEKELYLGQVEDMHAAILDGESNYLTLQETRDHVRTVLALYKSARSGAVEFIE
jgi:predicted dehydrogenase